MRASSLIQERKQLFHGKIDDRITTIFLVANSNKQLRFHFRNSNFSKELMTASSIQKAFAVRIAQSFPACLIGPTISSPFEKQLRSLHELKNAPVWAAPRRPKTSAVGFDDRSANRQPQPHGFEKEFLSGQLLVVSCQWYSPR